MTRRHAMKMIGATAALAAAAQERDPVRVAAVTRNDAAVRKLLDAQITDSASPWRGSVPDEFGLHSAGSAGGLIEAMAASFVEPRSRFSRDTVLLARIRAAAAFLERSQSPQGNIDLLSTNFNSPPDTGFVVHGVATAAAICKLHGVPEIAAILRPFLVKAGGGMAVGGIHTANHRWVVCAALAQVHELFPNPQYTKRIEEWLAEGIDIDSDGQYTERSTLVYNRVVDRSLVMMAAKLGRADLLDPVRRNLNATLYLLHADGQVVSEISRRQDQNARGDMSGYWFPLAYLALKDRNGQFATLARQFAPTSASLSALLEYPELSQPLPASAPLPDNFEKHFPEIEIARIRRGPLSATLVLGGSSRFFTLRYGSAVIEAVRFATSFFGKGQFIPTSAEKRGGSYVFRQSLEGPYYQPLAHRVTTRTFGPTRSTRRQSEVCHLEQSAEISETKNGFRMRVRASGTPGVPLAIEITYRDTASRDAIRVGPIVTAHRYTQLRGAEPKIPGETVYITGFTPFDHTISFECG